MNCPNCDCSFLYDGDGGMVVCPICGGHFYAYDDEDDCFRPTPVGADAEHERALGDDEPAPLNFGS